MDTRQTNIGKIVKSYHKYIAIFAVCLLVMVIVMVKGKRQSDWESLPGQAQAETQVEVPLQSSASQQENGLAQTTFQSAAHTETAGKPDSAANLEMDAQVVHSLYEQVDGEQEFVQHAGFAEDEGPVGSPFSKSIARDQKEMSPTTGLTPFEQSLIDQARANRAAVDAAIGFENDFVPRNVQSPSKTDAQTSGANSLAENAPIEWRTDSRSDDMATTQGAEMAAEVAVPDLPAPVEMDSGFSSQVLAGQHDLSGLMSEHYDSDTRVADVAPVQNQQVSGLIDEAESEQFDLAVNQEVPGIVDNPATLGQTEMSELPIADQVRLESDSGSSPMIDPGIAPSTEPAEETSSSDTEEESPGNYPLFADDDQNASEPEVMDKPEQRVAALPTPPTPGTQPPVKKKQGGGPTAALNAKDFLMADQPKLGAHYKDDTPIRDPRAGAIPESVSDFSPDPVDPYQTYDPVRNMDVYQGKQLNANQRPLLELGRPWYQLGQLPEPMTFLGKHNPITPQFLIFGDYRTAYATATQNGDSTSQIAQELNTFWHLQITGTDRFVAGVAPLDGAAGNTRLLLDDDDFIEEYDFDFDFGYYEGDIGSLVGGFIGETLPFDLPVAIGVMPLLVQNGIWMEDAFLGVAATIPARNSALLDISNMDITFFAGFDEIISPAFNNEDDAAKMWGMLAFIEATNGYWEIDYAFLEDRTFADRSYHNIGIAFTRRYGRFLSNSTRMIVNAGQSTDVVSNTADGVLLISENSLISGLPSTIVPYLNTWVGFDRPQSAARAGAAGGVLRNTGILFESDGMTGFPTLDATANDTYGAALGINIMPNDFSQQLVVEMAALGVMNEDANRIAQGDQYGLGFRYQLPISNSVILRADGMYGFLRGVEDVHGLRMEVRKKF